MSYTAIALAALMAALTLGTTTYLYGRHHAGLECVAAAAKEQDQQVTRDNVAAIAGNKVAKKTEAKRATTDAYFAGLQAEAANDTTTTTDGAGECELDANGLRRWRAANAGPHGNRAGQPDPAVPGGTAATEGRASEDARSEPHRIGAPLSPVQGPARGLRAVVRGDQ